MLRRFLSRTPPRQRPIMPRRKCQWPTLEIHPAYNDPLVVIRPGEDGGDVLCGAIEEPYRPPSAYWLYAQATRQAVQKDIGCRACCQVARTQSERWKNIPAAAKEKYKKQAAELKAKHEKDVAAFKKAGGVVGERRKTKSVPNKPKLTMRQRRRQRQADPRSLLRYLSQLHLLEVLTQCI